MKIIKLSSLIVLLGLALVACKKDDDNGGNTNTDNPYAGAWAGTFTGDDNGTWSATIDKDGKLTGQLNSVNAPGMPFDVNGNVNASGKFTATILVLGDTIDFAGQGSGGSSASGTWDNTAQGISGTWTGNKQ